MSQSSLIFGGTLFAFLVYITIKGELPTYIDFFTKPHVAQKKGSISGGGGGDSGGDFGEMALKAGETALNMYIPGAGTALDVGVNLLKGGF